MPPLLLSLQDRIVLCAWPAFYEYFETNLDFHGYQLWRSTAPGLRPMIIRPYMCLEVFAACESYNDRASALVPAIRLIIEEVARSI